MDEKYFDFIERMYSSENDAIQNIVIVTILEYLGDHDTVLKNAFSYFSENIIRASQSIEKQIGRRDIRIYYRNGKIFGEW